MSKSKAGRTRARDAKHVRLYLYMLTSEAWRSLSCPARCLLIVLQAHYDGTNNGELFLSVRDAAKALGTTYKDHASAAFRELEDRGFIRATRKGNRTRRGEVRMATCWRLTEFDDDLTGRQPSKEFMTWKPPAEPAVSARVERARKAAHARWQKNSTVPHKHTHRTAQAYGSPAKRSENGPERTAQAYAQADLEAPTVCLHGTQLVNHVGEPEKEKQKGRAAIAAPRKAQTTYNGKPTLKLRALDVLRANGVCRRADIIQTLACHPVEAGRVLRELIAAGMAEKVAHGTYRAIGRA